MKTLLLVAASALALSACQRQATLNAKLDCPQKEGGLTLLSAAGNGQSCVYRESDGAEVTLSRIAVKGDAMSTLATLEGELRAMGGAPTEVTSADKATAASAEATAEAARVVAEARSDAQVGVAGDDKAAKGHVTLQATINDDDEHTQVDLPGLHIRAVGDKADVRVGPIHIDADGDNSTSIKMYREVRLRGEALSREKRGLRATFIYAGDDLSGGYKYLGYEASGPKKGPITVAVVKSSSEGRHTDMYDDIKKLVRRNGGT